MHIHSDIITNKFRTHDTAMLLVILVYKYTWLTTTHNLVNVTSMDAVSLSGIFSFTRR